MEVLLTYGRKDRTSTYEVFARAQATRRDVILVQKLILFGLGKSELCKTKDLPTHDPIEVVIKASRMTRTLRRVKKPMNPADAIPVQIKTKQVFAKITETRMKQPS